MHRRDLLQTGMGIGILPEGLWGNTNRFERTAEVEPFHIVVRGQGEIRVFTPSMFDHDAAALQTAVDHIMEEWGGEGALYYPASKQDGSPLFVTQPVYLGAREPSTRHRSNISVHPRTAGAWINVGIKDGRPAFVAYSANHSEITLNLRSRGMLDYEGLVIGGGRSLIEFVFGLKATAGLLLSSIQGPLVKKLVL